MSGSTSGGQNINQVDASIQALILQQGEDMTQPIASGAFVPNGNNNTVNVPMRLVGLTRGFIVKIVASFQNTSTSHTATLTGFGPANIVSNFVVTDLDNYQRINTSGWHMNLLNSIKEGFPFGAAILQSGMDTPIAYGNNYDVISATTPIPEDADSTPGTGTVQMYYWVPLAYGKRDLRGALYTGVVNATAYLAFTINPTPVVYSGDATLAVYTSGGAAGTVTITNVSWTVYQNYIDQLPRYTGGKTPGAPILPPIAMRTQYRLVNTSLAAISANQDFPIPFTNFQSFLSASLIYDQNGTLNPGTDINYWKIAAANTLQFQYLDPITQSLRTRIALMTDVPAGAYMFNFRDQPINTNQAGNMQILLNPITAASGSQVLVGWESFADVNTILGAQSLPAS
jgi:hypothetical protein